MADRDIVMCFPGGMFFLQTIEFLFLVRVFVYPVRGITRCGFGFFVIKTDLDSEIGKFDVACIFQKYSKNCNVFL